MLESYLTMLEDYLQRDVVAPSPDSLVGCACLSAMAQLAGSVHSTPDMKARWVVSHWLVVYLSGWTEGW